MPPADTLPSLRELGIDLLHVPRWRRTLSLATPFGLFIGYLTVALNGYWLFAVASVAALSFVTYGSVSHDLVHRSLGLSRGVNHLLLTLIEGLMLRSGTAYRLSHLHHHARYPHDDDAEGRPTAPSGPPSRTGPCTSPGCGCGPFVTIQPPARRCSRKR